MNQNPSLIAVSAFALALLAGSASAAEFFISTSEAKSRIYKVETTTGASTLIGSTGISFLSDIAIDGNGNLYGTEGNDLYSINPNTAASTLVGSIGAFFIVGLDFDKTGKLWAVDEAVSEVWSIDPGTGSGTFEFATGVPWNGDIAHLTGDTFYANGPLSFNNNLWELDTNAESFSDRGTMVSGVSFPALDFDGDDKLWAFTNGGDIYEIQDYGTSANGVFSATTTVTQISGATFLIPEPSTTALFGLALVPLLLRRRR